MTVVIPTFGDPEATIKAVKRVRRTPGLLVSVVVCDDGTPRRIRRGWLGAEGHESMLTWSAEKVGYAGNVNRGLARRAGKEVVVLNSDVVAHRGWLECAATGRLQGRRHRDRRPKLLYPDGRIQSAGSYRNLGAPHWFDHRYRFQEAGFGPANVPGLRDGCDRRMHVHQGRELIEEIGVLDELFAMAFEDVD